jgi:hypothetical protein
MSTSKNLFHLQSKIRTSTSAHLHTGHLQRVAAYTWTATGRLRGSTRSIPLSRDTLHTFVGNVSAYFSGGQELVGVRYNVSPISVPLGINMPVESREFHAAAALDKLKQLSGFKYMFEWPEDVNVVDIVGFLGWLPLRPAFTPSSRFDGGIS